MDNLTRNLNKLKSNIDLLSPKLSAKDKLEIITIVEILLGELEEILASQYKFTASRLVANLQDVCTVNYVEKLNNKQLKCFCDSVAFLGTNKGIINKENANSIRMKLLENNITWLPVTDKAKLDILKARKKIKI
jgi:hypothetical protein